MISKNCNKNDTVCLNETIEKIYFNMTWDFFVVIFNSIGCFLIICLIIWIYSKLHSQTNNDATALNDDIVLREARDIQNDE